MPREYRHIEQYEKEIMKLREEGLSQREIGERLGFRKEQIKGFCKRKRQKERKWFFCADSSMPYGSETNQPKACYLKRF